VGDIISDHCRCGAPQHDGVIMKLEFKLRCAEDSLAVAESLVDMLHKEIAELQANVTLIQAERDHDSRVARRDFGEAP
jgi:hypothetical protein